MKNTTWNKIKAAGTTGLIALTMMSAGCSIKEEKDVKFEKKNFDTNEAFSSIKIDEIEGDIRFAKSSDSETHITYYDCEYFEHEIDVSNNELKIITNQKSKVKNIIGHMISFTSKNIETEILLPEDEYEKLNLSLTTGDVKIDNDFTFDEGSFEMTTGDLNCHAVFNDSLKVDCTTGNINIGSNKSTDLDDISVKAVSGNIKVNDFNAKKISMKATTGDIQFSELTADDIDVRVTTGKIDGKISDEYDIDASCTTGSCKTDSTAAADRTINAHCVTGSISIKAD